VAQGSPSCHDSEIERSLPPSSGILANSLLSNFFFRLLSKPRTNTQAQLARGNRGESLTTPEQVAAYIRRLDTTSLPFAIDAAHLLNLAPPTPDRAYSILDNACGSGAFVEWLVREFEAVGAPVDITATDYSAVMMNEVQNRRDRANWGSNVKTAIMDAQVRPPTMGANGGEFAV
jgi:2-polyprenyl-3-methyl-5-hydroxy-6-metoxy-1,4-benzoquinol methylase